MRLLLVVSCLLMPAAMAAEQLLPRTMPPLCRIDSGDGKQWVWSANTPACIRPPAPVRLKAPMPDMELLLMLNQSSDILARARLLMGGSTSCAPIRAFPFRLTAIDIGIDKLNVLEFEAAKAGVVQIAVRKYKHELLPWRVNCRPLR